MKRIFIFVCLAALIPALLFADAGVLIPRDKQQPNPAVLSLEEMEITVRIDNGNARVFVRQIFANHTAGIEEGNYIFALPSHATISDFATWDGPVRLPAVILERKRAEEIYNQLKQQAIDPGLLQMGERGAEEAKRSSVFSARITPIPAYGTKRLEIEYHEAIPVENLKSYFAIPLRPDAYSAQAAAHLRINFELHSSHAIRNFQSRAKIFPLKLDENTDHLVTGKFRGPGSKPRRRFRRDLRSRTGGFRHVTGFDLQESSQRAACADGDVSCTKLNEPGFFEAQALLGFGEGRASDGEGGEERVRSGENSNCTLRQFALDAVGEARAELSGAGDFAATLRPGDTFSLMLFNSETQIVPMSGSESVQISSTRSRRCGQVVCGEARTCNVHFGPGWDKRRRQG